MVIQTSLYDVIKTMHVPKLMIKYHQILCFFLSISKISLPQTFQTQSLLYRLSRSIFVSIKLHPKFTFVGFHKITWTF